MGMTDDIDRDVFDRYDQECEKLAEHIRDQLPIAGTGEHFDGREWCRENDIPETAFAYAVDRHLSDEADYGVSPMYPWKYEDG